MRAPLITIVLSIVGGAACAQPANEGAKGLESCFKSARTADAICSNPANDPAQRLDCLQKARTAQLECLEHVPPGMSAGSVPPEIPTGTVSPEMPASVSPETPTGTVSAGEPTSSLKPETPSATVSPDKPTGTVSPDIPARTVDIPAKAPDTNWIVSETTSPVDYSPRAPSTPGLI
jgi:hypothetical protein